MKQSVTTTEAVFCAISIGEQRILLTADIEKKIRGTIDQ